MPSALQYPLYLYLFGGSFSIGYTKGGNLLICWWCNMVALNLSVIVKEDKPAFLR